MGEATGYDGLSSQAVSEADLAAFLRDCFQISESQLFIAHDDQVQERLRGIPHSRVFAAFCTYRQTTGDFAMSFDVGIESRLNDLVGRAEFTERFAAHFNAYVLYGNDEPPGLWTVVLPDGTHLRRSLEQEEDHFTLIGDPLPR